MPKIIGNVELYMGPPGVGGPDDLQKAIVDFIDGAKKKLFIAVQELDNEDIARAIIRARQEAPGEARTRRRLPRGEEGARGSARRAARTTPG